MWRIVIHGGAGTVPRAQMTAEMEAQYRAALDATLRAGAAVLGNGGSALDAVEAAVRVMEDSPLFNAGKGSAFTRDGRNELDAAVMDGRDLRAGAVAGVTNVRNPVAAARAVMEDTKHVLLIGSGAEMFAEEIGLELVDMSYFWTERRWKELRDLGTVGAVAVDVNGNVAAATSTGGTTGKMPGRVGDTPLIGAGTYASNDSCAVSATGIGEVFIRRTVAYDVAALMKYRGLGIVAAADEVMQKLPHDAGGLIAVDGRGNLAMPFNTEGMYRGTMAEDGTWQVAIYG